MVTTVVTFSKKSPRIRLLTRTLAPRAPVLYFLLIPAVGLFCWQWNDSAELFNYASASNRYQTPLQPKAGFRSQTNFLSESLKSIANPRFHASSTEHILDPLLAGARKSLISAQGDPFMQAYLSGITEGELVITSRDNGVVSFGPPLPRSRGQAADRDILRNLDLGLGVSFSTFFANVLAPSQRNIPRGVEQENPADQNPFARAMEQVKGTQPVAKVAETPEAKAQAPTHKEQSPPPSTSSTNTSSSRTTVSGGPPAATIRPHVMLHVDQGGKLRSTSVSEPHEGTFESAEAGAKDFNLFPFTDAAEFPMAMAVGDFNGDSYPDLALDIAGLGRVRIYSGDGEGKYSEAMRIEVGSGLHSLAAGDFNRDARVDLAVTNLGTGLVVVLLGDAQKPFQRFKLYLSDVYCDYISAADTTGSGNLDIVGVDFANHATMLIDFSQPDGKVSGTKIERVKVLNSDIAVIPNRSARLNAVLLGSSLSVNIENRQKQLVNVLNVTAGMDVYVIVGDLDGNGSMDVSLATPIR